MDDLDRYPYDEADDEAPLPNLLEMLLGGACPVQRAGRDVTAQIDGEAYLFVVWQDGEPVEVHSEVAGSRVDEHSDRGQQYIALMDKIGDLIEEGLGDEVSPTPTLQPGRVQ